MRFSNGNVTSADHVQARGNGFEEEQAKGFGEGGGHQDVVFGDHARHFFPCHEPFLNDDPIGHVELLDQGAEQGLLVPVPVNVELDVPVLPVDHWDQEVQKVDPLSVRQSRENADFDKIYKLKGQCPTRILLPDLPFFEVKEVEVEGVRNDLELVLGKPHSNHGRLASAIRNAKELLDRKAVLPPVDLIQDNGFRPFGVVQTSQATCAESRPSGSSKTWTRRKSLSPRHSSTSARGLSRFALG